MSCAGSDVRIRQAPRQAGVSAIGRGHARTLAWARRMSSFSVCTPVVEAVRLSVSRYRVPLDLLDVRGTRELVGRKFQRLLTSAEPTRHIRFDPRGRAEPGGPGGAGDLGMRVTGTSFRCSASPGHADLQSADEDRRGTAERRGAERLLATRAFDALIVLLLLIDTDQMARVTNVIGVMLPDFDPDRLFRPGCGIPFGTTPAQLAMYDGSNWMCMRG